MHGPAITLPVSGYAGMPVPNELLRQAEGSTRLAIMLPGFGYTCDMPALYYIQNLLEERGFDVFRIEYAYRTQPEYRAADELEQRDRLTTDVRAAVAAVLATSRYPEVLLIGKSLGTIAIEDVLKTDTGANAISGVIWLTPVDLDQFEQLATRGRLPRSLVAIGTADPVYDEPGVAAIGAISDMQTLVLHGADHGFDIAGDVAGSVRVIGLLVSAVDEFLSATLD